MPFYKVPTTTGSEQTRRMSANCGSLHSEPGGHVTTTFSKLTEADRDSELQRRVGKQRELNEIQTRNGMKNTKQSLQDGSSSESSLEFEALEHLRRDQQLAALRGSRLRESDCEHRGQYTSSTNEVTYLEDMSSDAASEHSSSDTASSYAGSSVTDHARALDGRRYAHPGESRIVREVMEQRQRELELRQRWRAMGLSVVDTSSENETPFTLPEPIADDIWLMGSASISDVAQLSQRNGETESVDSGEASSAGAEHVDSRSSRARRCRVQPFEDEDSSDVTNRTLYYAPQNETPIEKEIRLNHAREMALRTSRGLPVSTDSINTSSERRISGIVDVHVSAVNSNNDVQTVSRNNSSNALIRVPSSDSCGFDGNVTATMKKLAASRLQQELQLEKQRELELLSQGKIWSISTERTGDPVRYIEVATDANMSALNFSSSSGHIKKRAALTKSLSNGSRVSSSSQSNKTDTGLHTGTSVSNQSRVAGRSTSTTLTNGVTISDTQTSSSVQRQNAAPSSGRPIDSQPVRQPNLMTLASVRGGVKKPSPSSAERRIEHELREMQQREDELRIQHDMMNGVLGWLPRSGTDTDLRGLTGEEENGASHTEDDLADMDDLDGVHTEVDSEVTNGQARRSSTLIEQWERKARTGGDATSPT